MSYSCYYRCQERNFKVHKVVICSQSDVFKNHVSEGRFKEGATGLIEITESESDVVASMIKFFYSRDYVDNTATTKKGE